MSRREALRKAHQDLAARDRRRLIAVGATGVLALVLFVALEITRDGEGAAEVREESQHVSSLALMPVDRALLATVKDGSLAEQLVLEPEPAAHLAANARTLLPAILQRLGEPAFPFAEAAERAAELRGGLFRIRGTLLEGETRPPRGEVGEEYWAILRGEDGGEAVHVSVLPTGERFAPGDWVRADGYFLKHHSLTVGGERRTLPLFYGARLERSVPRAEPAALPDLARLATVRDTPMLVEDEPDLAATWHLANVARTLAADPAALEAAFAAAPWLSAELLAQINETPEAFRAAPLRVGGVVFHGTRIVVEENPLREQFLSEAWLRNSNFGDFPLLVRAPGRVEWEKMLGAYEFRGWFQQMWAYEDSNLNEAGQGDWRRVPIFVFADARPINPAAPPFVGQIVWIVFGLLLLLAALLFTLVMRDRARARQVEALLIARRKQRRQA